MSDKNTITAAQLAKRLHISERTLTRYRRAGTIPEPLPLPGRTARWNLDTIREWERTGTVESGKWTGSLNELAAQGALGDDDKAAAREIRHVFALPIDARETMVLAAVLGMQTQLSKAVHELRTVAQQLRHLRSGVKRADAVLHPLTAPGTLAAANAQIVAMKREAAK